jgi:ParB-like chromosome segregation protein Spo0J
MTAPLVATTDRPYQLLPPLTVEQRDLLRQSIKENGVLEPVVFDEDGEILDGHHRVEIAEELGIEYPRRVIDDLDRPGKHMYALTVNVARRQLDATARGGLVAQMRIRGMSIRRIAETLGVSYGTVRNDLAEVSKNAHLPEEITGADGKSYAASRPTPKTPEPAAAETPAPAADPGPNLTSDIERALSSAGPSGMTAWQLAFLIDPAGPDADRAELAVRMAPILEQLAGERRARVVGEVDGGLLWAFAHPSWPTESELQPWETLAPHADAVAESMEPIAEPTPTPEPAAVFPVAVAGSGSTSPELEPERHLSVVPDPDQAEAERMEIQRVQIVERARRRAPRLVPEVRDLITEVMAGMNLGETGLVNPQTIADLRALVDNLEARMEATQ